MQRLFEQEIPEIADGVIEIHAMAREPGYRTKVAVSSTDQRVDCVGACVGVRGNRIKNIVDELAGERIDIVRWSDDMQVLIPNALQPAEVEEVILCQMLGRAIVLVREDQLSLAIGRRGQNVRLASKLCGWDIEIMTREELDEQIERAVAGSRSWRASRKPGREAGRRRLFVLRRLVGDRARRLDGDGRADGRAGRPHCRPGRGPGLGGREGGGRRAASATRGAANRRRSCRHGCRPKPAAPGPSWPGHRLTLKRGCTRAGEEEAAARTEETAAEAELESETEQDVEQEPTAGNDDSAAEGES